MLGVFILPGNNSQIDLENTKLSEITKQTLCKTNLVQIFPNLIQILPNPYPNISGYKFSNLCNVLNPTLRAVGLDKMCSMRASAKTPYGFCSWFYACLSWQLPPIFTCRITWPKNRYSSDVQLVTFRQSCKGSSILQSARLIGVRAALSNSWVRVQA